MKKSTFIVSVAVAVLVGAVVGYVLSSNKDANVGTISTAGTTSSTAKYYSQTLSLATAAGTTTSIYNGSGFDLAMRAVDVMCQSVGTSKTAYTGAGLAALNFKIATSSTNTTSGYVADINTNYLANINVGTSTTDSYNASSTEGVIAGTSRIIPNGTYAIISSNATNTASCAVGISLMTL